MHILSSNPAKKRRTALTLDDEFEAWLDDPTSTNCDDEVVPYIKSSFDEELDLSHFCQDGFFDIVKFWTCAAIKQKFPYLSRLALDVLSIPASSAASERLFSTCGNTITKKRSQLSSECLESVVVLCVSNTISLLLLLCHILLGDINRPIGSAVKCETYC